MARKMTKAQEKALGSLMLVAIVIGGPIYLIAKIGEAIGWPEFIVGVGAIIVGYVWYRVAKAKAKKNEELAQKARLHEQIERRRASLLKKYRDESIVDKIMQEKYWQGQTAEQLKDSLGMPTDVDEKIYKTKSKEIWKYHQTGTNRYGLRITLESGQVVGWDEKL